MTAKTSQDFPENPAAFPREDYQCDDAPGQRGMTLRDYFAGQVLPHAASRSFGNAWGADGKEFAGLVAAYAYRIADAMLAERSK